MSINGHVEINIQDLKDWALQLSMNEIKSINVADNNIEVDEIIREVVDLQLQRFKELVSKLEEGDDWRGIQNICSIMFFNAFFKVGNNAIRVANYYECLVEASDIETKKR